MTVMEETKTDPDRMATATSSTYSSDTAAAPPPSSSTGTHDEKRRTDDGHRTASSIGEAEGGEKPKGKRTWYPPFRRRSDPEPPAGSMEEADMIPDVHATFASILTFHWIQPLLAKGYRRPLQATDLWKLDDARLSGNLADLLEANYARRAAAAAAFNARMASGEYKPSILRRFWWRFVHSTFAIGSPDGKAEPSLAMAMSDTFFWQFWSAGIVKVISDGLTVTSPFVTRALITYGQEVYAFHHGYPGAAEPPSPGRGYGLAVGLLGMQICASLCLHQFFYRSMSVGVLGRGSLITAIYRRSLRLSSAARVALPPSKLVAHISTDVSRIDFAAGFAHMAWTAPVQLVVVIIILVINIGVSALAGVALMIAFTPLQARAMRLMFGFRRKAMVWTDQRAKLIQELLGGIKVLKFFAWEMPYLEKLRGFRRKEMSEIRRLLVLRSATSALAISLPLLGSVIAFVTYAAIGHVQTAADIFTALTLFNLLRMPLMMLPVALGTITDASQAFGRLEKVFEAPLAADAYRVDEDAKFAVEVQHASWDWEGPPPGAEKAGGKKERKAEKKAAKTAQKGKTGDGRKKRRWAWKRKQKKVVVEEEVAPKPNESEALAADGTDVAAGPPTSTGKPAGEDEKDQQSLSLRDISLQIPRGSLTAIVGPVGSGKSSLLQALLGEMKRVDGAEADVVFGGSVGYCPQIAWVQNATLRDNIVFGQPWNEDRYWKVVSDSCLEMDLRMLPSGDLTEIGQRGVNISGGQRQRVAIARALYVDAPVLMLDDPLSAVDAHVGKHLFEHAIRTPRSPGRTRVLVTHALHFLPRTDYIICMDEGRISERGTYDELMSRKGRFYALVKEFGGKEEEEKEEQLEKEEEAIEGDGEGKKGELSGGGKKADALMQEEERAVGVVGAKVYGRYFRAGNGFVMVPLLILALVMQQTSMVLSSYWLVWWQENQFDEPRGFYMSIYAALGVLQTVFSFGVGAAAATIGFYASQSIHGAAARSVLHAPQSFFDTQPTGRIMNRFVKDIDTIDNTLNDAMRMALQTFASIFGAIVLISIVSQYFLIAMGGILVLYYLVAAFYRVSARDIKRLDNLLRSSLYAHFSESLSGLATIRAYGVTDKFLAKSAGLVDMENRAYLLTTINQRWLSLRIDALGCVLTFIVALISVADANSISPSKIGLILTYILTISQSFSWMIRQTAEVENDFNSVQRCQHYADSIEQEPAHQMPDAKPPSGWPAKGALRAEDVVMAYRPGLPNVLKGLSMDIRGGEKVGIVGRTGAGKSSIMMALFRIVELTSGRVTIDGVDIAKIGLDDLRKAIAIIPQEALLFNGTIRSNLDPFGAYDDARLWDALKRSGVVDRHVKASVDESRSPSPKERSGAATPVNRYTLDSKVEDEGLNLSVGERSLVSLARALVKNAKIIVLDEATASVDFETDAMIQDTIRNEFKDATLLCIAHRLRTIISYDRIVVMDAGQIAEFDTPENLFDRPDGIFRSMCDRSSISRDDILHAAQQK